jgi:hypothetical protein
MSIPLDSIVGELQIIAGARQSTTPASAVFTAPRRSARGRAEDSLYVLVDLNGRSSSSLLNDLIQRLVNAYWSTPGSVTAALRAAINAGGEWLLDSNVNTPVADRIHGGVSCVVLRGTEAYIGQAGPACVYVAHQGVIEQFPSRDSEPLPVLGMARSVEVRFAHAELHPGDVVMLTDARTPAHLPIESIASAIVYVGIEQALRNLEQLAGSGDLIALVLETVPATTTATAESDSSATATASAPARSTTTVTTSRASTSAQAASTPSEPRTQTIRTWVQALRDGFKRGVTSVGTAGQALLQRTLPDPAAAGTQRRGPRGVSDLERHTPIMAGIAIGIPIIVALLVVTIYIQQSTQAEVNSLLIESQNEITLAAQASGPDARIHWQKAFDDAQQAIGLIPDNTSAHDRLAQAQAALDQIDNVVRVTPIALWDFKTTGPHRLAMHDFSIFVLDQANNQIDRITLNTAGNGIEGNGPAPVLIPGTSIDNQLPGNLIDVAWINSSATRETSSLAILHRNGLIEYNPTFGLKTLNFGQNTVPATAQRLRAYDGNLYIMDVASNQIWRYTPTSDGYANAPEAYFPFPAAELVKAIDIAIDGNVYVIGNDGQLTKYLSGESQPFQISGLNEPLQRPTAAAVDAVAPESSIYIADQPAARIVQLSPDGRFVRQFRSTDASFNAIDDLLVDEQNSRLFIFSQGVLYAIQMPPIGG